MKRLLSCFLALALACPPGLLAGTPMPVDARAGAARDFLDGKPLDPAALPDPSLADAARAAVAVQKGRAPGEDDAAYAERIRGAAKGLGLPDPDADAAVKYYLHAPKPAQNGGPDSAARTEAERKNAEDDAARASAKATAMAAALKSGTAQDPGAAGGTGASGSSGLTPEQIHRLNLTPESQGGPKLGAGGLVAALPPTPTEIPWSETAQNAGAEKLRQADAVPDDGSISSWAQRRWLQTQGVTQFIAGKAADGSTWSYAWECAKDVPSYPSYVWNGGKAVVKGVVDDCVNVYADGAAFVKDPSSAKAADFGVSAGLVAINFVGFGVPGALKSGARAAGGAVVKEAVELAAKDAAEVALKTAAERTAGRAAFREANADVIEQNLKIAGSAERSAAVRAQMPNLSEPQVDAVMKAHEAFPCAGAGCTQADLRGKYEIMSNAGMSPEEIRESLDRGLAGKFADWWNGAPAETNKIIGQGTGAFEGVTFTVKGEALALALKAKSPIAAIPLGEVRQAGMVLRSSQNGANARIVAEYSLLMKSGRWNWAQGERIVIGVGPKGENVILEGHHRVMAAQLAGVKIPESAFLRTRKLNEAFDWNRMTWFNRIK